jgi:hypothetical protein
MRRPVSPWRRYLGPEPVPGAVLPLILMLGKWLNRLMNCGPVVSLIVKRLGKGIIPSAAKAIRPVDDLRKIIIRRPGRTALMWPFNNPAQAKPTD